MKGHTWLIAYGDLSGAYGEVYVDRVSIENLTVPKQAVGVATSVSRTFVQDGEVDGLLGLGFTLLNSITPNPQKTWFDNIRANLSAPLFATALRRRRAGAYDFGYIDSAKYVGNITWTDVDGEDGFWDFGVSGFAVGGKIVSKMTLRAIADTGTSLWYLPKPIADAYWARVPTARYSALQAGWIFRCTSKLPDMSVTVSGRVITVPGINMNYQTLMLGMCYGGIQRETGLETSVFGDVFLKGLYVIHEQSLDGNPRLGFAKLKN
jgi:aspergillopepsin I